MLHPSHTLEPGLLHVPADTVREERRKETKNDAAIELAAVLHEVSQCMHQPLMLLLML
jgi:hypothetical protein